MKPLLLVLVACAAVAHANNDGFEEWDATHTSTNQNIPDYVDPLWSERVCTYTTSWGYTSQKCCSGWTGAVARGCPTPVCTTPCENGGICIKPNVCECQPGYTGNTCDTIEKGLCWTEWMNLDSPQQGIGDYELLAALRKEYAVCKHSVPVSIECETTGGIKVSGNSRENVVCDRRVGLTCDNTQTTTCEDYTVRMLCPCKSSNIDSKTCSYSGKEYDPEEITTQGCKTCTCLTTGRWSCSDDVCVSPLGHEGDTGHVRYGICLLGGKVYKSFQTASYGASSCMCLQSGAWSCNGGMSSAVNTGRCSTIDGTQYETGDIINNDCNKCICDNSKWECTDLLCPTSGILSLDNSLCKADDQLFQDGQVYRKDCNVCVCTTGKWDCSKYDCESLTTIVRPESCTDIDGIQHNHGRIVNRDCNTCVCLNGEWGCTRRFCQPEIYRNSICMDTETNSPVSSGEFIVRDCNVCVCNSGTFTCTKATCTEGNCLRQQRKYDSTTPLPGAYRPTCLGDGTYAPKQCNLDRTLCFCVDKDGNRIQGSSTESETTLNCSPNTNEESQTPSVEEPTTTQNCLTQRSIAESTPGLYPPSCEPDGSYSPLQCHLATWMCHCVDVNGITIKGTVKHISEGKPDCERYRNTNLNEKVEEDTTTTSVATPCSVACTESQRLGLPSPNCQQDGSFTPMQCTAQMCYCVDRQGVLIPSTITPIRPNIRIIKPDCEQYNRVNLISMTPVVTGPQTTSQAQTTVTYEPCFRHSELATNLDLTPMECNQQNGKFIPRQTTAEATYCIDKNGVAVPGTVTLNSPHNSAPDCEQYADLTLTVETSQTATMVTPITLSTPLGPQTVYIIPEPNTTISSLTLPKDLNTNNMTMCTHLQLMAITLEVPSPTCEPNGTFTPLQCTATACYCVDTQGMTIPGTETKITSTISTNINKSVCEKYRTVTITPVNLTMTSKPTTTVTSSPDTVLTSSVVKRMDVRFPEGTPCQQHYDLIKTNEIETSLDCYANGTFVTKQQNLTSGVVYCVDVNGITVPGTVLVNNTGEVPANYCQIYSKVNLTTSLPVIPNPVVRPVTIPTPLGPKTVYVVPDSPLVDTLLPLTTNTNVKSNITYTIPPCIRMTEFTAALDLPSPSCHLENGTFTPLQSTSVAYMCVDTQGTIIPGTIVKKTAQTTTPDCEKYRNVIITPTVTMPMKKPVNLKSMTMPRNVQDTTCNKHEQLSEEQNITPQTCHAENGTFTPLQCQDDVCHCVDMFGVAIPGTVTVVTATTPAPVCEQYRMVNLNATLTMPAVPLITPMTIQTPDGPEIVWTVSQTLNNITSSDVNTTRIPVCSRQQLIAQLMKVEPPTCTKDGLFVPQQISESVTYCVDAQGTILINSITPVHKNTQVPTLNCYQAETVNITPKLTTTTNNPSIDEPCNKQKTKTRALGLPNLTCHRQNGTFVPLQSHRDVAFCVDIRGVAIPGTVSPIEEGKTTEQTCEKYRYVNLETTAVSLPTPKVQPHVIPVTVFTPYGPRTMYMPLPTEKVTLDTTTSTTVPPCIKQQQVALTLGVEPPTCRPNGTFTTLQCTQRACYCVDTQGTLVPGTAVPITPYTKTMNLNCDRYWNTTIVNITTTNKPESRNDRNTERNQDVPSSSVELCSRTRQTTESMNLPNMKCLNDDTFNPLQATNNVYYCVDIQGRVVPGTLIPITHGMVIPNCDVYKNVNFTTTTAVPPMPVSLPVVMPITINTPFGSQVIYVVPETETNLTTVTVPTDTPIVVPIATNTTMPPCTRAQQIASMLKTPSPTCQDNGLFQPMQCTRDVCYCVDINGVIVPQTIRSDLENPPKCDKYSKLSIINTTTTTVEKINEPQTQSSLEPVENTDLMDGLPCLYLGRLYNHGERWMANPCAKCTCLNSETTCVSESCEIPQCKDSYVPEGKCCLKCPPMGPCTRHRRLMETLGLRGSLTCHDNGTFVPVQRRHGITYCVDSQGVTVPGTVTNDVEGRTRPNCEPYRTVNLNTTINGTVLLNPTLKPVVTNVTVITPTGPKTVIAVVTTNLTMEDTQVPTPFTGPVLNSANNVTVCSKNTTPTNIVAVTVMTENGTKTIYTTRQTTNKNNKTSPIHVPVITHTIVPPCTRHQQVAKVLGVHPPACEEKGMFSPLQCTSSVCYCVDMMGVIVPGTVRRTYDDDKPNCEQYKNVVLINMTDTTIMKKTTTLVPTSTGPCTYHQQLSTMFGVPKMNCHAENSTFTPVQCSGDVCYCVDKLGVSIPGTVTVTSDAVSMKSDCEKYRDVNLNISLNGTVIYSPFTQPIVTNVTVLTLSGPETVWGVVGTLYNPVKLSNTTPPLPDSPTSSNLVPILANSPAGPKTVLMVHPMQSEPVMSPYDNSTSNYTTTIRTPSGTITVLVTFNTSWATNLPFHEYTIAILRSTQMAPVALSRNVSAVHPPQQFKVSPHSIQSVNNIKYNAAQRIKVHGKTIPYSTYPLFPVLDKPTMTQTTTNLFTGNTLNKLVPVVMISPNGLVTVLMPETTLLTTTNTTNARNPNATEPMVIPMTIMTNMGPKTLWTLVNTTNKNAELMKNANNPVVVPLVSNTTLPPCLRQSEVAKALNAPLPTCESDGQFAPLQRDEDMSYCVDVNGLVIPETIIPKYIGVTYQCEIFRGVSLLNTTETGTVVKTKIITHPRDRRIKKKITRVEGPCTRHQGIVSNNADLQKTLNCHSNNGTFAPLQCPDVDTCFCVDSLGVTVPGTITSLGTGVKAPNCEQYRNVMLNQTVVGNVILPPHILPVVTNTTLLTPDGLKTVPTPALVPTNVSLTNNMTWLPFDLPSNVNSANLTTPQKVKANVTVMTPVGPTRVNVMATLVVTNSTINTTTLNNTEVSNSNAPLRIATPVRIPVIPTITISPPKVSHMQNPNRLTNSVTPNIVTLYTNMYTDPLIKTTLTAPVTFNVSTPLLLTPYVPYNTTTTSTQTPWFVPLLSAKFVNITTPFNISYAINTTEVVIGPVTVITEKGPKTTITPYLNSFVIKVDQPKTNYTDRVVTKIQNTVVTPLSYMTPWGMKKTWTPVVVPSWLVNMTQTSNLPMVTPTTITTPSGPKVIYTTQVPDALNITKTTPIVLSLVTNTTEPPCMKMKKTAETIGVTPPSCNEDGTFTPSQCQGEVCYCVDAKGVIVPDTVQSLGRPRTWCENYKTVSLIDISTTEIKTENPTRSSQSGQTNNPRTGTCYRDYGGMRG
ncbi:mucin-2-like [Ptychodera flava]|uniref:mucin-2-like n=1 Tax=Ptychodera flava TaxID=63121 RepID=UPI003969DFCB